MDEKPRRRWLSFRLRTVLVLVVVASIPLAYVGYALNWIRHRRAFDNRQYTLNFVDTLLPFGGKVAPLAPALLRPFGEKGVLYVEFFDDLGMSEEEVRELFPEASVRMIRAEYRNEIVSRANLPDIPQPTHAPNGAILPRSSHRE